MTLHRYFAWRFAQSLGTIAAVFLSLLVLLDLVEQLRTFRDVDLSFWQLVQLLLLNIPGAMNQILPLVMILATVTLLVGLARSSELVAARAAGRAALTSLLGPLAVAGLVGLFAVTTLNPIVAATSTRYLQLSEIHRTGAAAALSIGKEGLWLRQGGARGQAVIHAQSYAANAATLFDVTIYSYAPGGGPIRRIEAQSAQLEDGEWMLRDAKVWPLAAGLNPESNAMLHEVLRVPSTLTQDRIRESLGKPGSISVWDLPRTIRVLAEAGFATTRHRVWFQTELARPVFLIAMVMIGAAFTMRHTRSGGTGAAVLAAVLLGFALYFVRNFAQILGENGQLPVALAAWAPPAASLMLALGLLLHTEDG